MKKVTKYEMDNNSLGEIIEVLKNVDGGLRVAFCIGHDFYEPQEFMSSSGSYDQLGLSCGNSSCNSKSFKGETTVSDFLEMFYQQPHHTFHGRTVFRSSWVFLSGHGLTSIISAYIDVENNLLIFETEDDLY